MSSAVLKVRKIKEKEEKERGVKDRAEKKHESTTQKPKEKLFRYFYNIHGSLLFLERFDSLHKTIL